MGANWVPDKDDEQAQASSGTWIPYTPTPATTQASSGDWVPYTEDSTKTPDSIPKTPTPATTQADIDRFTRGQFNNLMLHPRTMIDTASEYYNRPAAEGESIIKGVGKSLGRTATMIPAMLNHPLDTISSAINGGQGEYEKAMNTHGVESAGHYLAGTIPMIGPMAANIGERIGTGNKSDIAGGLMDAATLAAMSAKGGKGAAENVPEMVANASAKTVRAVGKAVPYSPYAAGLLGFHFGPWATAGAEVLGIGGALGGLSDWIASRPKIQNMQEFGLSPEAAFKSRLTDFAGYAVTPETKAALESGKIKLRDLTYNESLSKMVGKDTLLNDKNEPTVNRFSNNMNRNIAKIIKKPVGNFDKEYARSKAAEADYDKTYDGKGGLVNPVSKVGGPNGGPDVPLKPEAAAPTDSIQPEWKTPGYQEISSNIKPVGRAGESLRAKAVDAGVVDSDTPSKGQFARANGDKMESAVSALETENDPKGQTLANHIHSMTNNDVVEAAKKLNVEPEMKSNGKLDRAATFDKILDKGHSPEDILNTHYTRLSNPPSVSGGSPSTVAALDAPDNDDEIMARYRYGTDQRMGVQNLRNQVASDLRKKGFSEKDIREGFNKQDQIQPETPYNPTTQEGEMLIKHTVTVNDGRNQIGQVSATEEKGTGEWRINDADLVPESRGKGYGVGAYEEMINYAKSRGAKELHSGSVVSPEAQRVWKSLAKKYPVSESEGPGGKTFSIKLNSE